MGQVVTQFITSDGTDNGDLIQVRRIYVQNGHVIQNSNSTIPGIQGNSLTESFCQAQKRVFADPDDHTAKGGLKAMGMPWTVAWSLPCRSGTMAPRRCAGSTRTSRLRRTPLRGTAWLVVLALAATAPL